LRFILPILLFRFSLRKKSFFLFRVEDEGDEDLEMVEQDFEAVVGEECEENEWQPGFEEVAEKENGENKLEPDFEIAVEEDEDLEEKEKREVVKVMLRIYLSKFY
jgi:hypothetical protein